MKDKGYEMEELLPLVARLAAKYTSGESTSVTYEAAGQLMEAVCYCIRENGKDSKAAKNSEEKQECELLEKQKIAAEESYRQGYERVLEKTRRAQEIYNELITDFQAYGNENYRDTVLAALPAFFMKYDPRFAPQETIIGLDYPTLRTVLEETGIDAVERYIEFIVLEQRFLRKFSDEMVMKLLTRFSGEYRTLYFNLCSVVLRHVLAAGLLGRQPRERLSEDEYTALGRICAGRDKNELAELLQRLTENLAASGWEGDAELLWYLRGDTENFAAELSEGVKWSALGNVVQ